MFTKRRMLGYDAGHLSMFEHDNTIVSMRLDQRPYRYFMETRWKTVVLSKRNLIK